MLYQVFEKPSAGRVRLRPNRGFPRCLVYDVTPYGIGRPIDEGTRGVHLSWQDNAESPGSDGLTGELAGSGHMAG